MYSPSLVVFDLDGTLIDTAPDLAATMNRLLERLGRPQIQPDSVRMMVGQGARVLMEKALAASGPAANESELDRLVGEFLDLYEAHLSEKSQPFPQLIETLTDMEGRGLGAAVCTNKPERLSVLLLSQLGLGRHFRSVVGGDTLAVRKPAPEPLLEAIRLAGGTREGAVMVGDSITDLNTARAAGVPFIGVSFGYSETPMAELGPDVLIDSFDELTGALGRL